jgi:branched-chain amino acid transport system ATP-binding protein
VRDAAVSRGTAVLLVEQHVRQALRYADRAYVLRRGRVVLSGTAAELAGRISEIEDSYLTRSTRSTR